MPSNYRFHTSNFTLLCNNTSRPPNTSTSDDKSRPAPVVGRENPKPAETEVATLRVEVPSSPPPEEQLVLYEPQHQPVPPQSLIGYPQSVGGAHPAPSYPQPPPQQLQLALDEYAFAGPVPSSQHAGSYSQFLSHASRAPPQHQHQLSSNDHLVLLQKRLELERVKQTRLRMKLRVQRAELKREQTKRLSLEEQHQRLLQSSPPQIQQEWRHSDIRPLQPPCRPSPWNRKRKCDDGVVSVYRYLIKKKPAREEQTDLHRQYEEELEDSEEDRLLNLLRWC